MSSWCDIVEVTAAAIAKAQRTGKGSPAGKQMIAKTERQLRTYFRKIAQSFPSKRVLFRYSLMVARQQKDVAEAYRVQEATVEETFMLMFEDWLDGENDLLKYIIVEGAVDGTANGFEGSLGEWLDVFGIDPPEGMDLKAIIPKSVIDNVRENAAAAVTGIDETTMKEMANVLANGLEQNLTVADMAKVLEAKFDDMGKVRSELIARVEMSRALEDGKLEANLAVGCDEKEWIETYASDVPRPEHISNMGDGRIKMDKSFSGDGSTDAGSGNNNPFNCACLVNYYGATEDAIRKLLGM